MFLYCFLPMKIISLFIISLGIIKGMVLFDFDSNSDLGNWRVVDDTVMGGRSDGNFGLNAAGHGVFQGDVSLENNGGFSSIRYRFPTQEMETFSTVQLRIKGDGKRYQFRIKSNRYDRHSYIYHFQTSGAWETIEIPLTEMEPKFRGRALSLPNYPGQVAEEIAFLISNKRAEAFRLEIDKISLR